jgi:hypothetical protein
MSATLLVNQPLDQPLSRLRQQGFNNLVSLTVILKLDRMIFQVNTPHDCTKSLQIYRT